MVEIISRNDNHSTSYIHHRSTQCKTLACRVPVDRHWSMCNAPTCRLRSQFARRRRDVGSGKQEEPYSCALVLVSTEAIALAFSSVNLSAAVDFTGLPDSYADSRDLTWEKAEVHSRGFWVSYGGISWVCRWVAQCDVFHSVLFWQTLGLWLPGQLTRFSKLANNYDILVRRPRNYHYIFGIYDLATSPVFEGRWL